MPHPPPRSPAPSVVDALDRETIQTLRSLAQTSSAPGENLLGELVELFVRDAAVRIDVVERAWRDGRAAEAARAAHTLKGAALQIGARNVVTDAVAIERAANGAFNADLVERLRHSVDIAEHALKTALVTTPL
jgi:HPt (histidine-containing phosphotransfer) domain-containing protein